MASGHAATPETGLVRDPIATFVMLGSRHSSAITNRGNELRKPSDGGGAASAPSRYPSHRNVGVVWCGVFAQPSSVHPSWFPPWPWSRCTFAQKAAAGRESPHPVKKQRCGERSHTTKEGYNLFYFIGVVLAPALYVECKKRLSTRGRRPGRHRGIPAIPATSPRQRGRRVQQRPQHRQPANRKGMGVRMRSDGTASENSINGAC